MKVKDLDGKVHNLNTSLFRKQSESCSSNHKRARQLLSFLFPMSQVLEEVTIPGMNLYLDFMIPDYKIAVEVHGEQHYSFSKHFHNSQIGFINSKKRDSKKKSWCEINGFKFIELDHKETDLEWREKF